MKMNMRQNEFIMTLNIDKRYLPFLFIYVFVSLNALFNALASAYGNPFPFNTFLFYASDLHADLVKMAMGYLPHTITFNVNHWDPIYQNYYKLFKEGWFLNHHLDNAHMPPFSYLVGWLLSLILQKSASPTVLLLFYYSFVILTLAAISAVFSRNKKDFIVIFTGSLLSYPLLFVLSRGNLFAFLNGVSLILFFYLLHQRKYLFLATFLMAISINLHPNALLLAPFFLVLPPKNALRYTILAGVLALIIFILSLWGAHTINSYYTFEHFISGLKNYMHLYVTGSLGVLFNNSLYGAIRTLLIAWKINVDPSTLLLINEVISGVGLLTILLTIYAKIKKYLTDYEFAFLLMAIYTLSSSIFATYHLLPYLFFLLIPFSQKNPKSLSPKHLNVILATSVFLIVPKNYIFIDFIYKGLLSIETLLNPFLLLVAVWIILGNALRSEEKKILESFRIFFVQGNGYFWFGLFVILLYLLSLCREPLYISIFDILDSTIPQLKILAHSGMIFANNHTIVPNMMDGLPRAVYGSEFNVLLWLNYLFNPKTAYIINQVLIHIVAYVSMYLLLSKYVITERSHIARLTILAGALYYGTLPFFSPEGLSIPLLPLVTMSLIDIKKGVDTKWDWLLLVLLPLYSSFIFIYMFYIAMAGIYCLWDSVVNRKINWRFFSAIVLMGILFLLVEYRLVLLSFFDHKFVSHRQEFHIFFSYDPLEAFRKGHVFFLNGHPQHLVDLSMPYVIPIILLGMFLSLGKRRFSRVESMIIWLTVLIGFVTDTWTYLLTQLYTIPLLTIFALLVYLLTKGPKIVPVLFLLQILFGVLTFIMFCSCAESLQEYFPILKTLNVSRAAFVQPLIWGVLLALSIDQIRKRLEYSTAFLWLFIIAQLFLAFNSKEYSNRSLNKFATFESYYEPSVFEKLKKHLPPHSKARVVSYGIEPAVALYNGFYTIDGYVTNYPLAYKHKFRKVIEEYLSKIKKGNKFDRWGSKAYIMSMPNQLDTYKIVKGVVVHKPSFNIASICNLGAKYLISSYKIDLNLLKQIVYIKGAKDSWDIYLYRLPCRPKSQ